MLSPAGAHAALVSHRLSGSFSVHSHRSFGRTHSGGTVRSELDAEKPPGYSSIDDVDAPDSMERRASALLQRRLPSIVPLPSILPASPKGEKEDGATRLQTGFNILNLYVGLGLLSQPYAFAKGGWVTAGMLALSALLFSYTGKLIVRAFAACDKAVLGLEESTSYPDLGYAVWGDRGRKLVLGVSMAEFVGASCMGIITYWQSVAFIMQIDPHSLPLAAVLTALVLPSVFFRSLAAMSFISLLGFVTSILIVAAMAFVWVDASPQWLKENEGLRERSVVELDTLPMALGIILFTFSAHVCLPSFRQSMKNPDRDFEPTMNVSFFLVFVANAGLAFFGYLMYGESAAVLITTNITQSTGPLWQRLFAQVVIGFVAFKSYCMIAPVVAIISEFIEEALDTDFNTNTDLATRCFVTVLLSVFAFVSQDSLGHVEALCGGVCSMLTSLLFPVYFYYRLYEDELENDPKQRFFLMSLVFLGIVLMIFVVASTIADFINDLRNPSP
eukprot:Hpha_TRINITY_DN8598_c0_g1::TRINITY_DN8598_c0_g1_i1::g.146554::m.146554/K15015/SLC32A, VGAT; solute carrier family 32 (vesicular inhibitory amino acid transporter)